MNKITNTLESIWYQDKKPPFILILLSKLYGFLLNARRTLFDLGLLSSNKPDIPVIIIGNLNIGGTGKTPFTLYLANMLSRSGKKVGIVSRGYKGKKSSSKPFLLGKNSNARDFGDEAVYLSRHADAMVCVCKKRSLAAHFLSDQGVDIILSDDGLQHYGLKRDIEFAVVSSNRGFGNRYLLPAGPLREGLERLETLDNLLVNGKKLDQDLRVDNLIGFEIVNREVKNIHDGDIRPIDEFLNRDVSLIAGIGDPEFLAESLKNKGINIHSIDVKDHEKIDLNTINEIENRTLFLTPKDLVKYSKDDFPKDTWELIPDLLIDQADQEIILNKVMKIV